MQFISIDKSESNDTITDLRDFNTKPLAPQA